MRLLRLGDLSARIHLDSPDPNGLADFVARITEQSAPRLDSHRFALAEGVAARLVLDPDRRTMALALPPTGTGHDQATVQIGLLQALARGIAFIEATRTKPTTPLTVLLHGSAFTISPDAAAVAVLDGGRGQGKTSLALGLAQRYGRLLVDEFAFATIIGTSVTVLPAPRLPWHIRRDMAQHLLPTPAVERLLFASDLKTVVATANEAASLHLVLIPDRQLGAGKTADVPADQARHLLARAVTEHLRKLADPSVDHVSIFDSPDQVVTADGAPLHSRTAPPFAESERVLEALVAVPVIRVGIGAPRDLPLSVAAAGHHLTELLSCRRR